MSACCGAVRDIAIPSATQRVQGNAKRTSPILLALTSDVYEVLRTQVHRRTGSRNHMGEATAPPRGALGTRNQRNLIQSYQARNRKLRNIARDLTPKRGRRSTSFERGGECHLAPFFFWVRPCLCWVESTLDSHAVSEGKSPIPQGERFHIPRTTIIELVSAPA